VQIEEAVIHALQGQRIAGLGIDLDRDTGKAVMEETAEEDTTLEGDSMEELGIGFMRDLFPS